MFPRSRPRSWRSRGFTPRQTRGLWIGASILVVVFSAAWGWSIHATYLSQHAATFSPSEAPPGPTSRVASSLLDPGASSVSYLNDAAVRFLSPLRGYSGKVNEVIGEPGKRLPVGEHGNLEARYIGPNGISLASPNFRIPEHPGLYRLAVGLGEAQRAIPDLNVVSLVPFTSKTKGHIGSYFLGTWPFENGGTPKTPRYENPSGFIEVTPQNQSTRVSEHFRLRDFLTKGQSDVWPKYLVLQPRLLDKLELVIEELQSEGHPVTHMEIMSGFRTPQYNEAGGNTQGRANLSRHMYGDASDVFIDNDRNGWMDDLNGDGKIDERDAKVLAAAADRVEKKYPALIGGVGTYDACCGHGPFVHIDVRGYRARWLG